MSSGLSKIRGGRFCGRCGRSLREHIQIIEGAPRICPLEFSIVNSSGKRHAVSVAALPTGVQRTKRNKAAWVHPDRV